MRRDTIMMPRDFKSSFLSCEKDLELILTRLFVSSQPYSDELKRLIVINTKDCLDNTESQIYRDKIDQMSLKRLVEEGYIKTAPKIMLEEHEEVKSYIVISFDEFTETSNPEFRDCLVSFDIICNSDYWDLGNFRLRPLKIAGYIDAIMNNARLTGIGQLQFLRCKELLLDEKLSGYTLTYIATHGSDDTIPFEE